MIKRAVKRAVARARGDHPGGASKNGLLKTVLCDLLLVAVALLLLAGFVVVVIALFRGLAMLLIGAGLLVLGVVLLIVWERLFWEPCARKLSELT